MLNSRITVMLAEKERDDAKRELRESQLEITLLKRERNELKVKIAHLEARTDILLTEATRGFN